MMLVASTLRFFARIRDPPPFPALLPQLPPVRLYLRGGSPISFRPKLLGGRFTMTRPMQVFISHAMPTETLPRISRRSLRRRE